MLNSAPFRLAPTPGLLQRAELYPAFRTRLRRRGSQPLSLRLVPSLALNLALSRPRSSYSAPRTIHREVSYITREDDGSMGGVVSFSLTRHHPSDNLSHQRTKPPRLI